MSSPSLGNASRPHKMLPHTFQSPGETLVLVIPEAAAATSGCWPGLVWSLELRKTCHPRPVQEGVGEAAGQRGGPLLPRARPDLSMAAGNVSRKQDRVGRRSTSQSYVTFGTTHFSKVFPPPPNGQSYPFLPSVNLGPGAQLPCSSVSVCLSQDLTLLCFPLLPLPSEAAQACRETWLGREVLEPDLH